MLAKDQCAKFSEAVTESPLRCCACRRLFAGCDDRTLRGGIAAIVDNTVISTATNKVSLALEAI